MNVRSRLVISAGLTVILAMVVSCAPEPGIPGTPAGSREVSPLTPSLPQFSAEPTAPATASASPAAERPGPALTSSQSAGRGTARGGAASSSGSPILLYGQDWNGAPSTRSTAAWEQAAKDHAILVGTPGRVYGNMITQLHGWNPALKVLVYDLGPYTIAGSTEYAQLLAGHPDYFARSASGALITVKAASGSPAYPKNTLMDEANPGWQAWEAQRIVTNIAKYGFDGAYVNSMGPGPVLGDDHGGARRSLHPAGLHQDVVDGGGGAHPVGDQGGHGLASSSSRRGWSTAPSSPPSPTTCPIPRSTGCRPIPGCGWPAPHRACTRARPPWPVTWPWCRP